MHKWIVGLNSAGKTVNLYEELDRNRTADTITNLTDVSYDGFDEERIQMIKSSSVIEEIWDYGDIEIANNSITIVTDGINYTKEFLNLITLLCRKGNTLILDEPEFGLYGIEINLMVQCLQLLLPTFENVFIATHCQELFALEPDNFYWCNDYQLEKITEKKLYEHMGELFG